MKEIIGKINKFADSMPCVKSSFGVSADVYRAASDKEPTFSLDYDGKMKFGFWQMCIVAASAAALAVVVTASISAKYRKKYNKKYEKLKNKFEKKEAKLISKAQTEEE